MDLAGINWVGVGIAAVAGFAFGAAYYTALSKHWLAAVGKTENEIRKTRTALPFVTSFVSLLVMASVLAGHFAAHSPGELTAGHAVGSAVVLWLGFIVASMATNYAFIGFKPKLPVIDSIHWLAVVIIQALVIRAF